MTNMDMISRIAALQDYDEYRNLHWEGSFEEYLQIVRERPQVTRNAFQRIYDMIVSYGEEEYIDNKKRLVRYPFFKDPLEAGKDAIYGLDIPLMRLVHVLRAAAQGYGPEKRIILLHGPVGSSKSTIARLLKKGVENYSRTAEGGIYTYKWLNMKDTGLANDDDEVPSPMNEEPLRLIPLDWRDKVMRDLALGNDRQRVVIDGDLNPSCRFIFKKLMERYKGDWGKVIRNHIRVKRLVLSEKDRVGIGTFQPKDEKNQDSTELTGDINYRKIAEYGSDSDPRAFNFDGEFNIANRGIIEFVEVLKLDVAFLYDLLGATQEHKIKPKKFAQTDIDEVIVGHSVAGDTPIPYRYEGVPGWSTLHGLHEKFGNDAAGLEVLAWDFAAGGAAWTCVKSVFRHRFSGDMLTTSQKWGAVETTPNHSIYDRDGKVFCPEERHEILAVRGVETRFVDAARADEVIDVTAGVEGFVGSEVRIAAGGGPLTRPARAGWSRLDLPRHATEIRALYHPTEDREALKDVLTVLVWYATEGHVNGRNGGIVISQADRDELERVRAAYARVTTGGGSIDAGAKTDSAWRLYLGSQAIARFAVHHCGEHSHNKRLPDFLFRLPKPLLEHAFDELMRTDGTRKLSRNLAANAGASYRERFFEYKTLSPVLAAQVGTLATMLGHDYSVYRHERSGKKPAYRIRFCSGEGKRGGRHRRFQARLHARPSFQEWVYDIECEGLHNFVCGVGNVVCHNTNEAEYKKLLNNEFMEALRDRTIKIDIPYITKLSEEIKIYQKDFSDQKLRGKHVAPHTLEVAAMWAVMTRLEEPKKHQISLLQKMKLYDGKILPGFTQDNVKELRKETKREGLEGISPRYVQDKISNALVRDGSEGYINPFMILNELEKGLHHHSLLSSDDQRKKYKELIGVVKSEYEEMVKNEVQRAISADEDAIGRLASNYIDNIRAYTLKEKVKNPYTGRDEEPDERLMRSIEEKIDIPESRKEDFRREIMNYIGALAIEGKKFEYDTNDRLRRALEMKLFEDQKDSIKLSSFVSNVIDKDTQDKIDVIKNRLIKYYGYNEASATDVLSFVASIFARGDVKE
jgi:serine protein kinase